MDHGDHDPPWWTRSVQDHLGPRSDIFLMEAHHQYRQLVGKEQKGKGLDQQGLAEAAVVTPETAIQLPDKQERVDAAKAAWKAIKQSCSLGAGDNTQTGRTREAPEVAEVAEIEDGLGDTNRLTGINEAQDLGEEMEGLEGSGDIVGEVSGGGVGQTIQVRGKP